MFSFIETHIVAFTTISNRSLILIVLNPWEKNSIAETNFVNFSIITIFLCITLYCQRAGYKNLNINSDSV